MNINDIFNNAVLDGFFDVDYFREKYNLNEMNPIDALKEYLRLSKFSMLNPSKKFDTRSYYAFYPDVYYSGMPALEHYIRNGKSENRIAICPQKQWMPSEMVSFQDKLLPEASTLRIAIVLHIYYKDFILRFKEALKNFPVDFDLFITVEKNIDIKDIEDAFVAIQKCKNITVRHAMNRGRNFAPMLVEFSNVLLDYDLVCHLHSKKSLYSGIEQVQWSEYLIEYLLRNQKIIINVLNAFVSKPDLGVYYPTPFSILPIWVNHWTKNRHYAKEWFGRLGEIKMEDDFINYPVGGMFWARSKAIKELLDCKYSYEDFPAEPLPADGSMLHALERLIGLLAEKNGYKQLFYHTDSGTFTYDGQYKFGDYKHNKSSAFGALKDFDIISMDLFDTLVRRRYFVPDYAKLLLGEDLVKRGIVKDEREFVKLRNEKEFELRQEKNFKGDVSIYEIYQRLGQSFGISTEKSRELADREFMYDFEMFLPKDEMIEIYNLLKDAKKELFIISDTYYSIEQIRIILQRLGISGSELFISSDLGLRKDNGTMWDYIKQTIGSKRIVHVGDSVHSDAQIPGDVGIPTFHILHPLDKWHALGFKTVLRDSLPSKQDIHKWGALISNVGRSPFLGE